MAGVRRGQDAPVKGRPVVILHREARLAVGGQPRVDDLGSGVRSAAGWLGSVGGTKRPGALLRHMVGARGPFSVRCPAPARPATAYAATQPAQSRPKITSEKRRSVASFSPPYVPPTCILIWVREGGEGERADAASGGGAGRLRQGNILLRDEKGGNHDSVQVDRGDADGVTSASRVPVRLLRDVVEGQRFRARERSPCCAAWRAGTPSHQRSCCAPPALPHSESPTCGC